MKKVADIISKVSEKEIITLIEDALVIWRTHQTRARGNVSLNKFAEHLGVSRSLLSMWLLGQRPVTHEYRAKIAKPIADLLGTYAYNILDIVPPNPYLQKINQIFERLSPEQQKKLAEEAERYEAKRKKPSSPTITRPLLTSPPLAVCLYR